MTMQHQIHPDDERLAALAGNDPDVASDAALRAHVSGCDRCRATVDELGALRSVLAELPDLRPSRRLQLLPPVAEPRASGARGGWLRRLAAPVMAAGFGLVLVGAVGTSGLLTGSEAGSPGSGADSAANALNREAARSTDEAASPDPVRTRSDFATESDGRTLDTASSPAAQPGALIPADQTQGQTIAPAEPEAATGRQTDSGLFSTSDSRLPWLVVLGLGVGLLAAGVYLRFAAQPRAGKAG
jgi:hypothetical protein